jgi:hypothetical protein
MAEDRDQPRELNWRQLFPWTELFQGFRLAIDYNKLLLAAGGLLTMALGWWVLANLFLYSKPDFKDQTSETGWAEFKRHRDEWNLVYKAAGAGEEKVEAADIARDQAEYNTISRSLDFNLPLEPQLDQLARENKISPDLPARMAAYGKLKPAGKLRIWPWFEDRGPNPFLLVSGETGIPWEAGHFWDWLLTKQAPVLLEPLIKFLLPIKYFFDPHAGVLARFYFILVMLWTVATWALFGGAISRIAAVQVARQEKIGMAEALRFTAKRYLSYASAPIFPLVFVVLLLLLMMLFGVGHIIPVLGEFVVDGLLWPLMFIVGLVMAVVLVGLVSWPLMSAAISAEGTDSWEAVSRSYSYLLQAPWNFLWYSLVAIAYGAVIVFFVGFMGSLTVYLSKWGVSQSSPSQRDPAFLFVKAPTSFGWRELLLQGGTTEDGQFLVENGRINQAAYDRYLESFKWYNLVGVVLVSVWTYLVFLLVVGFGYSYFWTSATIIYFLMRRKVDDAEIEEVYLEEEEQESAYPSTSPETAPPAAPSAGGPGLTMVEPPSLRTPPAPSPSTSLAASGSADLTHAVTVPPEQPPPAPKLEPVPPSGNDGNPPTNLEPK